MTAEANQRWCRVFGRSEAVPSLESVRKMLGLYFSQLEGWYRYDDTGWIEATFQVLNTSIRWTLTRYTRADDDIRGELQAWAASLENSDNPHRQALMEHLTVTQQVFTFPQVDGLPPEACIALCRCLASSTDGVWQIDGEGFFSNTGEKLGFAD